MAAMERRSQGDITKLAEERNAAATRLAAKGKLREALDAVNEAIRIAPEHPHSFLNRAEIFARLGMQRQAEADRRRAQELVDRFQETLSMPLTNRLASGGKIPDELVPRAAKKAPRIPWPRRFTIALPSLRRPGRMQTVVAIFVVGLIAIGILLALSISGGGDSGGEEAPRPAGLGVGSPTPSLTETVVMATPTAVPTATPVGSEATAGAPYSLVSLQRAWEAAGLGVTLQGRSAGFRDFGATTFDVRVARGSDSMDLSILVYEDREAALEDWKLTPGEAPAPVEGRSLPDHISNWWNQNVVVVVRSSEGDIASDALDAFLSLSP
jgi:hypothetical protein